MTCVIDGGEGGEARDRPGGEAGVVGVAQQLVRVPDGHHPVSDHLEAEALVVRRLVNCTNDTNVSLVDGWGS